MSFNNYPPSVLNQLNVSEHNDKVLIIKNKNVMYD